MSTEELQAGQPIGNDPEQLSRLLEIELIQKRAEWQRTTARNKTLKSVSLFFLFVVVLAGLIAFYFVFTRASDGRQHAARPPAMAQP